MIETGNIVTPIYQNSYIYQMNRCVTWQPHFAVKFFMLNIWIWRPHHLQTTPPPIRQITPLSKYAKSAQLTIIGRPSAPLALDQNSGDAIWLILSLLTTKQVQILHYNSTADTYWC